MAKNGHLDYITGERRTFWATSFVTQMPFVKSHSPLINYLPAIGLAAVAFFLQMGIRPWVGDRIPFLFFIPAIIFCAVALGRGPSLILVLAGGLYAAFWAMPPGHWDNLHPENVLILIVYSALGIFLVIYGGRLRLISARAALAEERLKIAQDTTDVGVFELDFQAGTAFVSPNLCRLLGRPELKGPISLVEWLVPLHSEHPMSEAVLQRRVEAGELLFECEEKIELENGEARCLLFRMLLTVTSGGKLAIARGATMDITERKQQEKALEEMDRRKNEFLATLSHELRNPLAPLRNSLAILRRDKNSDPSSESIYQMMDRQLTHLVRLVDDLMEISRISKGTLELRKEKVDVETILSNAVEMTEPFLKSAGHHLNVSLPNEPLWLEGDPIRLTQIVANLLNNAGKYTDGGGDISTDAQRRDNAVIISVRDSGIGISAEELPHIFESFKRGKHPKARVQDGLGIGLSLARRLAEMHEGTLEARSEGLGKGSEFILCLPLISNQNMENLPIKHHQSTIAGTHILIVDDNVDAGDSLAVLLKLLGAEVRVARNGVEALETLESYHPSVVLLDIGMPGMDGYEVARTIRVRFPAPKITLVALTGWGQKEDRRRALDAGFDHHLIKPVDIETLQIFLASLNDQEGA